MVRVFTRDFFSGEMKYLHSGVLSISCNCLHNAIRNESHCSHFGRNEISLLVIK